LLNNFVHESILEKMPDLDGLLAVKVGNKAAKASRIHVVVPNPNSDKDCEVCLRLRSSDIAVFRQVFIDYDYDSPNLPDSANVIVDLGANIGLATVFFATRYPGARILCVEPEAENFKCMVSNTESFGSRVTMRHAAVWTKDGLINLHTEDDAGRSLGAWGAQVSENVETSKKMVSCYKMATLLDNSGFTGVDILKVDIEGAELELFSHEADLWLPRIKLLIIETHDRFRPGTENAVRKAIAPMFEELPGSGENLFFRRRHF
jgi:FkbM family methyltransferase